MHIHFRYFAWQPQPRIHARTDPERQNARMSKIKNGGLDQYGKVYKALTGSSVKGSSRVNDLCFEGVESRHQSLLVSIKHVQLTVDLYQASVL